MSDAMNFAALAQVSAANAGATEAQARKILVAALQVIGKRLKDGHDVSLRGFGGFASYDRAPRQGTDPRNGQKITIPARRVVKFTPSRELLK